MVFFERGVVENADQGVDYNGLIVLVVRRRLDVHQKSDVGDTWTRGLGIGVIGAPLQQLDAVSDSTTQVENHSPCA